jgi:glucose/arabinose dehydrogenase
LAPVASGLESPLFLTAPPGDARLFVVEQPGRVRVIKAGKLLPTPFLDVTADVSFGGERGLLGVAFHPRYARTGYLYLDYTDRHGDTRIVRYHVSRDADRADAASAKVLLTIPQPFPNHNGGMISFGPDSMLYIGMGDGGSGGDPQRNGQNLQSLLAKLLRIDVDHGEPYAIPRDNPYAHGGGRGEIWASGLRNPWRYSFDRGAPWLYIADVGQNKYEEVNATDARKAGLDYGWNTREGLHEFSNTRQAAPLTDPVVEYAHSEGCSVTGGYAYRGRALGDLAGTYFFSDYCQGWLRSFRLVGGKATEKRQWDVGDKGRMGPVTSFGEDAAGELYVITQDGNVRRLVRATAPSSLR